MRTFWWPGWRRDVKAFVTSCDSCQRNKSSTLKPAGLLQPLDIPERRWEHVTMDLITCLPKTARGHDAVLVFVDKLTKMTHFAATTSDASAQTVAQLFIDRVVCLHGVPRKIITDRDKRFTGRFFQAVCEALQATSAQSTAFHPQTDGQTERMNRVLEDMMRHYVSADHSDWDIKLSLCEFAINGSVQASTGNTPFFLNYGQEPLTPLTVHTDLVVPSARVFADGLQQAIKQARQSLEQAVQRQKAYADRDRRDVQFKEGDQVLLATKHLKFKAVGTPKFLPRYIGPFTVIKRAGPVAVKLDLPTGYNIHPVFHVSLIKHYKAPEHCQPPQPVMELDEEGMPVYVVECIQGHRQRTINRQPTWEFLVKWVGFGPEHNSWEPFKHFTHPRTMIQEYWDAQGGEPPLLRKRKTQQATATPPLQRPTVRSASRVQLKQSARLAARRGGV
jgi:hypothetical protein